MKGAAGWLLFSILVLTARADSPPRTFLRPDRIRYDGQCLTIEGRAVFIFSGSFDYFRCPKPLWRDRFRKIKEAGCNTVATDVPWNWHERRRPASPDDFSQVDLADLQDWLRMAREEFGLYVIVRPGPYIGADWDGGGFPRWLLTLKPREGALSWSSDPGGEWLRSDDPVYLAWARHWMKAVCAAIAPEQITRQPPGHPGIILLQIENEYDRYEDVPAAARVTQLQALYQTAVAGGIEVPIFTCETRQGRESQDPVLRQIFDTLSAFPGFDIDATAQALAQLESDQPDAPAMIAELQGGAPSLAGGPSSEDQPGLTAAQLNAHALLAIENGATILNCSMIFGGTNFGLWGSRHQTASYDFAAPIREPGGIGDKYLVLAAIGRMLQEYGPELARSHPVVCQVESGSPDVTVTARSSRDKAIFLFFRNHSRQTPQRGSAVIWLEGNGEMEVHYRLEPLGFQVLRLGPNIHWPFEFGERVRPPAFAAGPDHARKIGVEWLPEPVAGPSRPAQLPTLVRLATALMRADPGGSDEIDVPAGDLLPELGVGDARPVVYKATVTLTADQIANIDSMRLEPYFGDGLVVQVNGRVMASGYARESALGTQLHPGDNTFAVLYQPAGQPANHKEIQDEAGLRSVALGVRRPDFIGTLTLPHWRVARTLTGVAEGWAALAPGTPPGWARVALDTQRPIAREGTLTDAPSGPSDTLATWYRVEFALPAPQTGAWVPWRALIDAAGNGLIYLNGHPLGRYWEAGPQREFYLPECWLQFGSTGKNVLTLCLSPMQKGVRLRAVAVAPYAEQAELRLGPATPAPAR